jgi:hypothetical protein
MQDINIFLPLDYPLWASYTVPFSFPFVSWHFLTDILNLHITTASWTQIGPQRAVEQLLQHLEAHA